MGFWSRLVDGPPPDASEAERLLAAGRAALWRGDGATAVRDLERAASGPVRPALALAYLSLARRQRAAFEPALEDARRAVGADPACLEARAALSAALLSSKDLVTAALEFRATDKAEPHDRDGHALRLLLVALYADALAGAREEGDELRLDFALTPAARCAVRTLDGRPLLGVEETLNAANSPALDVALGAAYWFAGTPGAARTAWERAQAALPDDGRNGAIRASLKTLCSAS